MRCFQLVSCVAPVSHGFALPLFVEHGRGNAFYIPECWPKGDHLGIITKFKDYDADSNVLNITPSRLVCVGDPWLDVFLWNQAAIVGTPAELWKHLKTYIEDLTNRGPLSLFNASMNAHAPERDLFAKNAIAYVQSRFGHERAFCWRNSILNRHMQILTRRFFESEHIPIVPALFCQENEVRVMFECLDPMQYVDVDVLRPVICDLQRLAAAFEVRLLFDFTSQAQLKQRADDVSHFWYSTDKPPRKALLIEPNVLETKSIEGMLLSRGCSVLSTDLGEDGIILGSRRNFDVIITDLNLSDIDGYEVISTLRASGVGTPILVITSQDGIADRVRALKLGADDYLIKPFHGDELLMRVLAITRRDRSQHSTIRIGSLTVNIDSKAVKFSGDLLKLTKNEYIVIEFLSARKGETVTKSMLLDLLYPGADKPQINVIDRYIAYLRKKLGDIKGKERYIQAVSGIGYKLVDPSDENGIDDFGKRLRTTGL